MLFSLFLSLFMEKGELLCVFIYNVLNVRNVFLFVLYFFLLKKRIFIDPELCLQ